MFKLPWKPMWLTSDWSKVIRLYSYTCSWLHYVLCVTAINKPLPLLFLFAYKIMKQGKAIQRSVLCSKIFVSNKRILVCICCPVNQWLGTENIVQQIKVLEHSLKLTCFSSSFTDVDRYTLIKSLFNSCKLLLVWPNYVEILTIFSPLW